MTGDHAADLARALEAIDARKSTGPNDNWTALRDVRKIAFKALALYRESTGREDGPSAGEDK